MKFFLLKIISLLSFQKILNATPISDICSMAEYRDKYLLGTNSITIDLRNIEINIKITFIWIKVQISDFKDFIEDLFNGGILYERIAISKSRVKYRWRQIVTSIKFFSFLESQIEGG